jgi:hypothetical protein
MKDKIVLGVDPGDKGAIAVINVHDRATTFIPNNLPPYDIYTRLKELEDDYDIVGMGIEKVHAIKGTSAGSNFKFGYNTGVVTSLLCTINSSLYEITPKTWQSHIGLVIPKGLSPANRRRRIKKGVGDICSKLYPTAKIRGIRGGLKDGRSDSLMIAHTIMEQHYLDKL